MAVLPKDSEAYAADPANDEFFLGLVKAGDLDVGKDGKIFNTKTEKEIGSVNKTSTSHSIKVGMQDKSTKEVRIIDGARLVYLVHSGKIPEGKLVSFKDGDPRNISVDNLELTESVTSNFKDRVAATYNLEK